MRLQWLILTRSGRINSYLSISYTLLVSKGMLKIHHLTTPMDPAIPLSLICLQKYIILLVPVLIIEFKLKLPFNSLSYRNRQRRVRGYMRFYND